MEHNFTAYPENNVLVYKCDCGWSFDAMGDPDELDRIRATIADHRKITERVKNLLDECNRKYGNALQRLADDSEPTAEY
ncbi:MAG: hypothetical protein K2X93_06800 [Candidatus Obscuribacterales bacterium]|nr:hypothetical protein [Candidatus Obscuribacterales bacterium]